MTNYNNSIKVTELISAGIDFLSFTISKEEILKKDFTGSMNILEQLTSNISVTKYFRERVDIFFDGYNETSSELWEIPEVRDYVAELDAKFPYWLFFLSKNGHGLLVVLKCFLLPFLRPEMENEMNGKRLKSYLENRGLLAMNHLCKVVGVTEQENIEMTKRLINYLDNHEQN